MVAKTVLKKLPKTTEKFLRNLAKKIDKKKVALIRKLMKQGVSFRKSITLSKSKHLLREVK
jgi:hypothetical protein